MFRSWYQLLAGATFFGGLGAAFIGINYALVGFKTGDVFNALPPAAIAVVCMAVFIYSMGKVDSDTPQVTDVEITKSAAKPASWDNPKQPNL